jgi:glycosyltransferase involved in cell wall biosynthesis
MNNSVKTIIKKENPLVSVIIPSLDGFRNGNVPKLLEDIKTQTVKDLEVIIVKGVAPNGRARNEGVKVAQGKYIVSIDDDVSLGNDRVIENLISPFLVETRETGDEGRIGLTGASQLIPEDSSYFQKRAIKQIPRTYFPIVNEITETDMVSHMCLAIPAQLYKDIGWENDVIHSGTDPDLRFRVRQAGYKIVVVPNTWAYHPLPKTLYELLKMSYNKGEDSAWVRKNYPQLVYELSDGFKSDFKPKRSFSYRITRGGWNIVESVITFKLINFASKMSYTLGYLVGTVKTG